MIKTIKLLYKGNLHRFSIEKTFKNLSGIDKLSQVISQLFNVSLKKLDVYYKDDEDENITIDSSEDLVEALNFVEEIGLKSLKIYLKDAKNDRVQVEEKGLSKDAINKSLPKDAINETSSKDSVNETIHYNVYCDGCYGNQQIVGNRYKCNVCCDGVGYDLCTKCFNMNENDGTIHWHKGDQFEVIEKPKNYLNLDIVNELPSCIGGFIQPRHVFTDMYDA